MLGDQAQYSSQHPIFTPWWRRVRQEKRRSSSYWTRFPPDGRAAIRRPAPWVDLPLDLQDARLDAVQHLAPSGLLSPAEAGLDCHRLNNRARSEAKFLRDLGGAALYPKGGKSSGGGTHNVPGMGGDKAKLGTSDLQVISSEIVNSWAGLINFHVLDADEIIE